MYPNRRYVLEGVLLARPGTNKHGKLVSIVVDTYLIDVGKGSDDAWRGYCVQSSTPLLPSDDLSQTFYYYLGRPHPTMQAAESAMLMFLNGFFNLFDVLERDYLSAANVIECQDSIRSVLEKVDLSGVRCFLRLSISIRLNCSDELLCPDR